MYSALTEVLRRPGLGRMTSCSGHVIAVRSASSVMPCVDCGVRLHPASEAARKMLALRCTDDRAASTIDVMVNFSDGQLRSVVSWSDTGHPTPSIAWVTCIRSARDRLEQNVEVVVDSSGHVIVRTVRALLPGQELLLWYGEELARNSGIPLISPANITRDEQYICSACKCCFRYPNALKSHILFDCRLPFTSLLVTRCRPSPPFFFQPWLAAHAPTWRTADATSSMPGVGSNLAQLLSHACATSNPDIRSHCEDDCQAIGSQLPVKREVEIVGFPDWPNGQGFDLNLETKRLLSDRFLENKKLPVLQCMLGEATSVRNFGGNWPAIMTSANASLLKRLRISQDGSAGNEPRMTFPEIESEEALLKTGRERSSGRKRARHHCSFCGKVFSRKYGLTIHLRTHSGQKPLKCKICLRHFGDPSNLNKHVRLHGYGETPYRCRYCGKVLVRKRDLERHVHARHPNALCEIEENACNDVIKLT